VGQSGRHCRKLGMCFAWRDFCCLNSKGTTMVWLSATHHYRSSAAACSCGVQVAGVPPRSELQE
jgi:hypothetical protein